MPYEACEIKKMNDTSFKKLAKQNILEMIQMCCDCRHLHKCHYWFVEYDDELDVVLRYLCLACGANRLTIFVAIKFLHCMQCGEGISWEEVGSHSCQMKK